jgi:hypothetical protein
LTPVCLEPPPPLPSRAKRHGLGLEGIEFQSLLGAVVVPARQGPRCGSRLAMLVWDERSLSARRPVGTRGSMAAREGLVMVIPKVSGGSGKAARICGRGPWRQGRMGPGPNERPKCTPCYAVTSASAVTGALSFMESHDRLQANTLGLQRSGIRSPNGQSGAPLANWRKIFSGLACCVCTRCAPRFAFLRVFQKCRLSHDSAHRAKLLILRPSAAKHPGKRLRLLSCRSRSVGWCLPVPRRPNCEIMRHPAKCRHSHHCGFRCVDRGTNRPSACGAAVGERVLRASNFCTSAILGSPAEPAIDGRSNCCGLARNALDEPRRRASGAVFGAAVES